MNATPYPAFSAPSGAPSEEEPVTGLFGDLRLELEPLLARFQLSEGEVEEILREILLLLIYRWERLDSPEIWLLAACKRACLRRLGRRARVAAPS
jgi:DNA-directed RNA polymerase specialized sigma24 family protein